MSMLTLHAYGTWLPDRREGYWHHTDGIRPQNFPEAEQYRSRQRHDLVIFTPPIQRLMIESSLAAKEFLRVEPICLASSSTHVHAIMKWPLGRTDEQVRQALKQTLTRRLNARFGRRTWFVRKGWCQEVQSVEHFAYLMNEYLPGHRGWFWLKHRWREPIR